MDTDCFSATEPNACFVFLFFTCFGCIICSLKIWFEYRHTDARQRHETSSPIICGDQGSTFHPRGPDRRFVPRLLPLAFGGSTESDSTEGTRTPGAQCATSSRWLSSWSVVVLPTSVVVDVCCAEARAGVRTRRIVVRHRSRVGHFPYCMCVEWRRLCNPACRSCPCA